MPSKIKVLQVIPKLGYGGAETGCYDIAHYLHEKDFGSYIVTSGGDLLRYVNREKVRIFRLPVHSKNPLLIILNSIILSFLILILNIDIVHARSRAPAWSSYFASKKLIRSVSTYHNAYNYNNNFKKIYNSGLGKMDKVIAISNFVKNKIIKSYNIPENKIDVI